MCSLERGRVEPMKVRFLPNCFSVTAALLALLVAAPWGVGDGTGAARAEVRNPDGVAIVVGNRGYTHPDVYDVSFAHRDADAFRRYVVDVLGFDPENILDLRDASQAKMEAAFGNERSHEGILWRYLNPDGGAAVVVFYSGHGVPGLKDGRGYLLPSDADPNTAEINGYPIDLLYGNLAKLTEAESVWVFLDACFSGSSHRGMLVRAASPASVTPSLPAGVAERVTLLTAASGDQVASWDEEAGHGLFTHHLLDALYGAGDGDGDGLVTAQEAKAHLDRHMTRAARRIHGRHQRADLRESGDVVLAAAPVDGAFPARPRLDAPEAVADDGADTTPAAIDHAAVELSLGLERSEKELVQRGLAALGFAPGGIDGLFGGDTRKALRAWQAMQGHEVTDYLTADHAKALMAAGETARREQAAREAREKEEAERRAREEAERKERERVERERAAKEQAAGREAAEREAKRQRVEEERRADDAAFANALSQGTPQAYRQYTRDYPRGDHIIPASSWLAKFRADLDRCLSIDAPKPNRGYLPIITIQNDCSSCAIVTVKTIYFQVAGELKTYELRTPNDAVGNYEFRSPRYATIPEISEVKSGSTCGDEPKRKKVGEERIDYDVQKDLDENYYDDLY